MTHKSPPLRGSGTVTPLRQATVHSLEAEQCVLGGLMLDNSAWPAVAEIVSERDFFRADHRLIFQAIAELAARGDPCDAITLGEALQARDQLVAVGGLPYLGTLYRDTPSAANLLVYARLVRQKSLQRQMRAAIERNDLAAVQVLGQQYSALTDRGAQRGQIISAADLLAKPFSPVRWAVPDLLPEGVTLLAGSPKLGKSWLGLGLAVAIATGGVALGRIRVDLGDVLYLALEDTERRLQRRLQALLHYDCCSPARLHFATDWPRLNAGGANRLESWLREHPQARLIIADTLEKVRPHTASRDRNLYTTDYIVGDLLTPLSKQYGVAIVLIHHTRKGIADDPLELVSGTLGLTGGVDGVMVLRRQRGQADAFLFITGRDVEEKDYALTWDQATTTWAIRGDAQDFAGSDERVGLLALLREHGPLSVKEIAGWLYPDAEITKQSRAYNATKQLVFKAKMAGTIERRFDGRYRPVADPLSQDTQKKEEIDVNDE